MKISFEISVSEEVVQIITFATIYLLTGNWLG